MTITVEALPLPKGEARPYTGQDKAALEALKPAKYAQSDDELIVKRAAQIVGSSKDASESALKLAAWVHNMTEGDLTVGNASASEVIRNHEGDCKAFSVLLAALCRAAGIPARTADGYLYVAEFKGHSNVFGGHQWTQVFIGGKWLDLDATLASPFNSAGRITLGVGLGNEDDMLGLVNVMGTFTITNVAVENAAPASAAPAKAGPTLP
jgi:transglutaminase-like putative cysteine protease